MSPPDFARPERSVVAALAERLVASGRKRLGRTLAVFPLDTGGCGGCALEWRLLAAGGALARLGVDLVATPRHADVLLIAGSIGRNLAEAVAQARAAMAEPAWVVALGDCAADGGVFRGSYAVLDGVSHVLPVDLVVRGCPPAPSAILAGLIALLEANAPPPPH